MLAEHLVFCPKYRVAIQDGEVRAYALKVISDICGEMGLEILSMAVGADHVHIFYRYPPCIVPKNMGESIGRVTREFLGGADPW